MLKTAFVIAVFGLLVGGCASDSKMDASSNKSSTSTRDTAISSPSTSGSEAAQSNSMNQSRPSRSMGVPSGAEEQDTLEACLGRIPRDATAGQRMLAEQSCRRDYAGRP
jgi:hypothetical protein